MTKKIKNLHELGVDLLNVYAELRNGTIEKDVAKTLAKVADVVIDSAKTQVLYNTVRMNIQKVKILENGHEQKLISSK